MQLKHFTLCAAPLAMAAGAPDQAAQFHQADSLAALPMAVQQQLGVGNPDDPIADRGERFSAGCMAADGVPRKRFLIGAVAAERVVVAIERGGIAHLSETYEWRRQGGHWRQSQRSNALPFPRSLAELLQEGPRPAVAARAG